MSSTLIVILLVRTQQIAQMPFAKAQGKDRHCIRGQLGAVVADDHLWLAAIGEQTTEFASDPNA